MKVKPVKRRWKVLALGILALACIGIVFNIWFVQNTNSIIEQLVSSRSNGSLFLRLKKSSFSYFSKKIVLHDATFYAIDTSGAKTSYQFVVPKLDLKVRSVWAFVINRELLIDSIALNAPEVTVTRLSKAIKNENADVSIAEEIGRIYNSILDALQVLQVRRFRINDGKFNLVNKIDSTRGVTSITDIHFNIDNLKINNDSARAAKFLYSDNVVLRVRNQNFVLPDGIHHIQFKNLLINVGRKQVQLDSCLLRAETQDNGSSFNIFFDILKMTNLDFAALYRKSLIKADSVYINNPNIELALALKRKKERSKKLELDTIIQQFTGDLDLGYIGVQNAAVNIVANRSDTTTTFSSKNDNFKMFGLRVNSDSAKPVTVAEFAMILRNYETYSRDSSAVYRFDSLRFTNNKVRLSNFTIRSISGGANRASLFYSIPAFELSGLSWDELLFDRYISARSAVLYNPEIEYSIAASRKKTRKSSLFKVLSGLNESINLDEVEIRNGNLNIQLPGGKKLNLQRVNLVLASNKLLASTSYTGMQQAINAMSFRNAVFTTGDIRAELVNLQYADQLYADALHVTNASKTLVATAKGITLNDLVWNNQDKSVFVDHLGWKQATIVIKTGRKKTASGNANAIIQLQNLAGKNTKLEIDAKDKKIVTTVNRLQIARVQKAGSADLVIEGLIADGTALNVLAPTFTLKSGTYRLTENSGASINNLVFSQPNGGDSLLITIPKTFLNTHVSDLLKSRLLFKSITAQAPVFRILTDTLAAAPKPASTAKAPLPVLNIDALSLQNPVVQFIKKDSGATTIHWSANGRRTASNTWAFQNIATHPSKGTFTIDKAVLAGDKLVYQRYAKQFGIDSGLVRITLTNIEAGGKTQTQWQARLQEALFENPIALSLNKQGGFAFGSARLSNVMLSSNNFKNVYQLLQRNPALQLQVTQGNFKNETSHLHWQNILYSQRNQSLSVDSFSYQPALSRDSAIAKAPGQIDHMHAVLKNITATGIDLTALEKDSVFQAQHLAVNGANLDIYRDKRKPFISAGLRPLPVLALQNLKTKLSIDTVSLANTTVSYTEMSDKTAQEGSITINRINAQLFPVRNINVSAHDSLTLRAEGYLMDTAWLRLRLKESYLDTLGTFAMTLRMKPTPLAVLNPTLMPLASVKLLSGTLDTVSMRAIGNEYFSIGEMKMFYSDLKIQFLKKGSETKKTFLTGLITFAANNFIIKKHNTKRVGTVYFVRNRDRSLFNFLIKSAMSGVASSVGAKKNKKYQRQYKKQQKLYKLPPVDFG